MGASRPYYPVPSKGTKETILQARIEREMPDSPQTCFIKEFQATLPDDYADN